MRFLYSFLYTSALIVALPYFLIAGILRGKYLHTIWQRLGNIPQRSDRQSIWIHAVSVGEFLACKTLISRIQRAFPEVPVFVSTTTVTGQKLAKQLLPDSSFYFPLDWAWAVRKILKRIRPMMILVLETEIWPNFLWTTKREAVPAILINGRLSDRSMTRYSYVKKILPKFTESWMQTPKDAERMKSLNADSVFVMGNLKYDVQPAIASDEFVETLSRWKKESLLWIAGSTMDGEEEMILAAFQKLKGELPLKLLIAPRHPERFSDVESLILKKGLTCNRRSNTQFAQADILLLDTIGELAAAYRYADIVLIGGTLLKGGGGHNPIEPAYYGKPILAGPNFMNFRSVFEDFQKRNAILITSDLSTDLMKLLSEPERRSAMGQAAQTLVQQNSGATEKVLNVVQRYLPCNSSHPETAVLN
jgi:3-deoxy-D-manno-octulosonic-acid transferase